MKEKKDEAFSYNTVTKSIGEIRPVLDHGFVQLVDVMGCDGRIVEAARTSYGKGTKTVREDSALIDYLMRHNHTSPFEMGEFTFRVRAPIFVNRQWFRHRTASVNEESARYSEMQEVFYLPQGDKIRTQSKQNKQGSDTGFHPAQGDEIALDIRQHCKFSHELYKELLDQDVARELARIVLPVNLYSTFYWKQDLHNLLHFLSLRLDSHAQEEIRSYAQVIAGFVEECFPAVYKAFVEHRLEAIRLSKTELEIVRTLLDAEKRERFQTQLLAKGWSERRVQECLVKIFG